MASFDENGKYIKTNWKAGDKITATKLNKIEESIEAVNDNDISRHVEADARLDALEAKDVAHDKEFTNIKNTIANNKAAAELGDYEINSRMQFLEQELNEGIEEVHNVASTVDGKIATAEANMTAQVETAQANMTTQVDQAKADMEAMVAEVEADLEGLHAKDEELSEQLAHIESNAKIAYIDDSYDINAINKTILENDYINFKKGTYNISQSIIIGGDNKVLDFMDSTIFMLPGIKTGVSAIKMTRVKNIIIKNVNIDGNKTYNSGNTENDGINHGIAILDACEHIVLEHVNSSSNGTDGVCIGGSNAYDTCKYITIKNSVFDNNTRQGCSIIDADYVDISNCVFSNTRGKEPQAGIDIEPNSNTTASHITINNCSILNNNKGIAFYFKGTSEYSNIKFNDCTIIDNDADLRIGIVPESSATIKNIAFNNCKMNKVLVTDINNNLHIDDVIVLNKCEMETCELGALTLKFTECQLKYMKSYTNVIIDRCIIDGKNEVNYLIDARSIPVGKYINVSNSIFKNSLEFGIAGFKDGYVDKCIFEEIGYSAFSFGYGDSVNLNCKVLSCMFLDGVEYPVYAFGAGRTGITMINCFSFTRFPEAPEGNIVFNCHLIS